MANRTLQLLSLCFLFTLLLSACQSGTITPAPLDPSETMEKAATISRDSIAPVEQNSPENTPESSTTPTADLPIERPLSSDTPDPYGPQPTLDTTAWLATALPPVGSSTNTLWPSRTPTLTPTPRVPLGRLYFEKPGPYSKLVSPIDVVAVVIPGADQSLRLELLGEDGRPIYRELLRYPGLVPGARFMINPIVEFEIPGLSEAALLRISIQDPEGRMIAITSMDVVLLSIGDSEINRVADLLTPYFFQHPVDGSVVRGDRLVARGKIRPVNDQPLIFELIADNGGVLGSKQLAAEISTYGEHAPFEIEIPYTVNRAGWARLVVRQPGVRFPGDLALASVRVFLQP